MKRLTVLSRDQRGNILLPALVMGCVLVCVALYQVETWKAVQSREQVQIAADAIAATGASWLASGMNVLALVNVLMAMALAVFVAWRAAEIVCVTVAVVAVWIPGGQGVAAAAGEYATTLFENERSLSRPIFKGLEIASKSERAIAIAFPYVSVLASGTAAYTQSHSGDRDDHSGIGLSYNLGLVPTMVDKLATANLRKFPERMGSLDDGMLDGVARKLPAKLQGATEFLTVGVTGSLPVEAEAYPQLCSRATERGMTFLTQWIPESVASKLDWVASFLGGNLSMILCQDLDTTLDKLKDEAENAAVAEAEEKVEDWAGKWAKGKCRSAKEGSVEHQKCIARYTEERKNSKKGKARLDKEKDDARKRQDEKLAAARKEQQGRTDEIKTAQLWSFIDDDAVGGTSANLFLDAWAYYEDLEKTPPQEGPVTPVIRQLVGPFIDGSRITNLLSWKGYELNQSSSKARIFFAYDCEKSPRAALWGLGKSGRKCAENAMWIPGEWTWNMATDRKIGEEAQATKEQFITGYLGFLAGEGFQALLGKAVSFVTNRRAGHEASNPLVARLMQNWKIDGAHERWGSITFANWTVGDTVQGGSADWLFGPGEEAPKTPAVH